MPVSKRHCAQAVLLLLALLGVLVLVIYIPWQDKMSFYAERQGVLADRLQSYNRMLAQKPQLEQQLGQLTSRLGTSELFIRSTTAELAAAELQSRIRELVEQADAKLISTQNLGMKMAAAQNRIAVRVRLTGDIDALAAVLYQLESHPPVTIIENLSMRAKQVSRRRSKSLQVQHLIDMNFDLVGFVRLGENG